LKLKYYTGLYKDKIYGEAEITFDGTKLKLTFLLQKRSSLQFWNIGMIIRLGLNFNEKIVPEGYLTFELDSSSIITGCKIDNQCI
jgi:hypothetical protein